MLLSVPLVRFQKLKRHILSSISAFQIKLIISEKFIEFIIGDNVEKFKFPSYL